MGNSKVSNPKAREAFLLRQVNGLNLSDRVWRYTNQFKAEIEAAIDIGLRDGLSADEMSRAVRQYLNYPNKLFRRVRDEHGQLQLSKSARAFHPGRGVYRSSYKNARRLTTTEGNMAYLTANHIRYQSLDFVVGIEVVLSNNHTLNGVPFTDICDDLKGRYPKDFKFTGWHPHCRCSVVSVLKTEDEFVADRLRVREGKEPLPDSVNSVRDVPKAFKDWLQDNGERIGKSKTLPYFLKDNEKYFTQLKPLTALERARIRHEARTPEQAKAIKDKWAEREKKYELIKKGANNILRVAKSYNEVDFVELEKIIQEGDLSRMKQATKETAQSILAIKKQEQALADIIPNVHEWHKEFSIAELQEVHKAVKLKLQSWEGLILEDKLKKLQFEVQWVENNKKYSTWAVAKQAYNSELKGVQYKIATNKASADIIALKVYSGQHPKALNFAKYIAQAEQSIENGEDINVIAQKIARAEKEQKRLQRLASKKNVSGEFGDECYTKERKNNAFWTADKEKADDKFRASAYEVWKDISKDSQEAIYTYTTSYCNIQEPLRNIKYTGCNPLTPSEWRKRVNNMTESVAKSRLKTDCWLQRGDDMFTLEGIDVFKARFGVSLNGITEKEAQEYVGIIGHEKGFLSAGSCKNTGFDHKVIITNFYAPKGTQALYINPISYYGGNYDGNWKGELGNLDKELETLIQRGAKLKITKITQKGGTWFVDVDILGFDYSPV